ncbi:hypothetical protein CHUAL_005514 [Chamberlinius hualienensis]
MKFDSIIREAGDFGRYQIFLLALFCCPVCIFISYVIFGQMFISLEPEHWCRVPQLEDPSLNLTEIGRKLISIPQLEESSTLSFDSCRMYDLNYSELVATGDYLNAKPNTNWSITKCKYGWSYNFTEIYPTVVSEWDWVCDDNWKPYMAQSIFFIGCSVGCLLFGIIADTFGRVPAFFMANGVACAAGIATAFSQGYFTFAIFRFLAGTSFNTCFLMFYIILLEYTGPSKRTLVSNVSFGIFHCLSAVMIPWVAYLVWNWRMFAIATSAPIGIILPLCFVIPESASWLLARGKVDKAIKIIEEVARFNKKQLSPTLLDDITKKLKETEPLNVQKKYTLLDVFKRPLLRKRALVMFLVWFLISLCADGHARNTHNLGYSVYYTFSASSATQLPAGIVVLLFLDRIGRRWSAFLSLVVGGAICLSIAAVPIELKWLSASLAMIGRLLINVSFNIGLQYAPELLPTVVRGQAVLATHLVGFIANILSPFIVYLAKYYIQLPLLVFGCLSVIGGFLCLFLPETLHENLPNSLDDADNFGSDQKFFHFPCQRRHQK